VEEFSNSLAIHSNVVVSKSNGPIVTLSSGPAQYGSLSKADKAIPAFVLGPGDVISKTLNSRKGRSEGRRKRIVNLPKVKVLKRTLRGLGNVWKNR